MPLLYLPAAVPLLIAALACSVHAADGDSVVRPLALVLLYDAIVGLLAYAVCEHALDRLTPLGTHDRLLRPAVLAAGSLLVFSTLLIALWVPSDRAEGFRQRIFYLHVPIALTAYLFLWSEAFYAARYLLRRDPMDDLRSYVAIHQGVIFGTLVSISGPIWAKVSWGIWWDWSDKQLVHVPARLPLLLRLFHAALLGRARAATGQPLRGLRHLRRRADPDLVPGRQRLVELRTPLPSLGNGSNMAGSQLFVFCVSLAAMLSLAAFFDRLELAGKRLRSAPGAAGGADVISLSFTTSVASPPRSPALPGESEGRSGT